MFIRLNSRNVHDTLQRWCKEEDRMEYTLPEREQFMREVENTMSRRFELGLTVNYYELLRKQFECNKRA